MRMAWAGPVSGGHLCPPNRCSGIDMPTKAYWLAEVVVRGAGRPAQVQGTGLPGPAAYLKNVSTWAFWAPLRPYSGPRHPLGSLAKDSLGPIPQNAGIRLNRGAKTAAEEVPRPARCF